MSTAEKIDIEFEDIYYSIKDGRKGKKQILKGVSGKFKSRELTAIMGPSGAGKSSLMNVLTGFQIKGIDGKIHRTGDENNPKYNFKRNSCYILQDDHLVPLFTVWEIMVIASDLKLGPDLHRSDKNRIIENILKALSLSECKRTRCGSLSGGQQKRLSIALELIDNPQVMFLDEPTTGLDSSSSLQCITILKTLAREGRTIICTIHQPSATVFEMFDHIYVLAQGKCAYQGDPANTVAFLSTVGLECPTYHNPADFIIEAANGEYGDYVDALAKAATNPQWRTIQNKLGVAEDSTEGTLLSTYTSVKPPSEFSKFFTLLRRTSLQLYRDWTIMQLKLVFHICVGIFLGLLYKDYGNDGSKTIRNLGYLMISLVYLAYTSMMPAVLKFPLEVAVLKKERFNNWYKLKTYYAAYIFVNIPLQILFSISYTAISYVITGQPMEFSRFLMFLSTIILVSVSAESLGIILGITVDPINGTFLGAISLAIMLSVGGFLIYYSHMSLPMNILPYFSYISYGFEGLVQALYDNRNPLPCPDDELYCHYRIPDTLLNEIGVKRGRFWFDCLMMCLNVFILKIAGFFLLKNRLSTGG